jgi:hypothetical protein
MNISKSIYTVVLFLLLIPLSVQSQDNVHRTPGQNTGKAFEVLQQQIDALQQQVAELQAKLAAVSINYDGDMVISGVNVFIQDGQGSTYCGPPFSVHDCNGKGNLIVGYNEYDGEDIRTGSHNVVLGALHTYTSYSGIVAGRNNEISNVGTSVISGQDNVASGLYASVCAGRNNVASGRYASVSGGDDNVASGVRSSVSGGNGNIASGDRSSVSGGRENTTSGENASVSGGLANTASGLNSSVSGGVLNESSGENSSVGGGNINNAQGVNSTVSGGYNRYTCNTWPDCNEDWAAGSLYEDY